MKAFMKEFEQFKTQVQDDKHIQDDISMFNFFSYYQTIFIY